MVFLLSQGWYPVPEINDVRVDVRARQHYYLIRLTGSLVVALCITEQPPPPQKTKIPETRAAASIRHTLGEFETRGWRGVDWFRSLLITRSGLLTMLNNIER